jgi:hypothetical protein
MSQGRRAWNQLVESTFVVCLLLVAMECVLPVIEHQSIDWQQLFFACVFGALVVLGHTVAAYVRQVPQGQILQREEPVAWQPAAPTRAQFSQLRQWAQQDPTWRTTAPNLQAYQPEGNIIGGRNQILQSPPIH